MEGAREGMDALDAGEEAIDVSSIGDKLEVVQLLCCFRLGVPIEPSTLAYRLPCAKYTHQNKQTTDKKRPDHFNRVMCQFGKPPANFALYRSGKVCLLNAKSLAQGKSASRRLVKYLSGMWDYRGAQFLDFVVKTMAATLPQKYCFPLNIRALEASLLADEALHPPCKYDPYRGYNMAPVRQHMKINGSNVCVSMFKAGGVKVIGGKSTAQLKEGLERVYPYMLAARLPTPEPKPKRVTWKDMSVVRSGRSHCSKPRAEDVDSD